MHRTSPHNKELCGPKCSWCHCGEIRAVGGSGNVFHGLASEGLHCHFTVFSWAHRAGPDAVWEGLHRGADTGRQGLLRVHPGGSLTQHQVLRVVVFLQWDLFPSLCLCVFSEFME